jgi:uncharacterized repeat protein (TIGR01451 family)
MNKTAIIMMMALLLAPAAARAQQKGGIELISVSEVESTQTNAQGQKEMKRIEASKANVVPGDTVIFTNYYTNTGKEPATGAVIKNPVPEHMVYVDKSAEGKGTKIEFSVDNGKTFAAAGRLKVKDASGKERVAVAADYTHIRWIVEKPVAKGGKGSVSFRAKVK